MKNFPECLICSRPSNANIDGKSKSKLKNDIVKCQVRSIFVLRELLDISNATCVDLLQTEGTNPSSWFSCCWGCFAIITDAEKIFHKLVKLKLQWKILKTSIKKKLREAQLEEPAEPNTKSNSPKVNEKVVKKIREEGLRGIDEECTQVLQLQPKVEFPLSTSNIKVEVDPFLDEYQSDSNFEPSDLSENDDDYSPVSFPKQKRSSRGRLIKYKNITSREVGQSPLHSEDNVSEFADNDTKRFDVPKRKHQRKIKQSVTNNSSSIDAKEFPLLDQSEQGDTIKCEHCENVYTNVHIKNQHENRVHGEKHEFPCSECFKSFPSVYMLKRHLNTRHKMKIRLSKWIRKGQGSTKSEEAYVCPICSMAFKHLQTLKVHKRRHSLDILVVPCQHCNQRFKNEERLKIHIFRTHNAEEKPFECEECGKRLSSRKNLEHHVKAVHRKEKDFVCEVCCASFTSHNYLKFHQTKYHGNTEEFQCKECNKVLCAPASLRKHIETIHRRNFKFYCSICNTGKNCQSALDKHILQAHTEGPKPFQCPTCPRSYIEQRGLNIHMRTHSGVRPFKCTLCPSAFFEKKKLLRHVNGLHSDERRFECSVCQKKFPSQHYLSSHIYSTHNKKISSIPAKKLVNKDQLELLLNNNTSSEAKPSKRFNQTTNQYRLLLVETLKQNQNDTGTPDADCSGFSIPPNTEDCSAKV